MSVHIILSLGTGFINSIQSFKLINEIQARKPCVSQQVAMQEVRNQKMLVEQTKADLTLARSTHQEESARLQQDIQILRVKRRHYTFILTTI